jgi:hypothetical protein
MKVKSLVTCTKCSREGHNFVYYPYLSKKEKLEIHLLTKAFIVKFYFIKKKFLLCILNNLQKPHLDIVIITNNIVITNNHMIVEYMFTTLKNIIDIRVLHHNPC